MSDGSTQAVGGTALAEADDAGRGRGTLPGGFRKAALLAVFAAVFLTIGVPRFLAGVLVLTGVGSPASFAKLCRAHGGTVAGATGPRTQPFCEVRYGATVYRMDAITRSGFDEDTAAFQRQGCVQANDEAKAAAAGGTPDRTFVYHALTGVCEHRP